MKPFYKNQIFPVEAYFERSVVLSFAVPREELESMIPDCLSLDLFDEKWGFLAFAIVQTSDLRPKGFPQIMGQDFILLGYRIFVRYKTSWGKELRGLYILRSETDKRKMAFWGNLMTRYNYSYTDIVVNVSDNLIDIRSNHSKFILKAVPGSEDDPLPLSSPFKSWKEARRFAGPLPFTFTYDAQSGKVLIIEGVRQNWKPRPLQIIEQKIGLWGDIGIKKPLLANAFLVENIHYHWKKGIIDQWKR